MINLGRYSGKGLPNVYIPLTLIDWILTGVAIAIMLAIWIMIAIYYQELSTGRYDFLVLTGACLLITILFIWSARAPVRFVNFPVRINEENIQRQYFLMSRFMRIVNVVLNLLFLCLFLRELETYWEIKKGLFEVISFVLLGLLGVAFVGYYVMAFRWR